MRYAGPHRNEVQDFTVDLSNGQARASISCDAEVAEDMLNQVVYIYPSAQDEFVGVVTSIQDFGRMTGTARLGVESLVNIALKEQYKDTTSTHTTEVALVTHAGSAYKGSRFGAFDEATGDTTDDSVGSYIRRIVSSTKSVIAERYGQGVTVGFEGKQIGKTIPVLTWQGDSVSNMIFFS